MNISAKINIKFPPNTVHDKNFLEIVKNVRKMVSDKTGYKIPIEAEFVDSEVNQIGRRNYYKPSKSIFW